MFITIWTDVFIYMHRPEFLLLFFSVSPSNRIPLSRRWRRKGCSSPHSIPSHNQSSCHLPCNLSYSPKIKIQFGWFRQRWEIDGKFLHKLTHWVAAFLAIWLAMCGVYETENKNIKQNYRKFLLLISHNLNYYYIHQRERKRYVNLNIFS